MLHHCVCDVCDNIANSNYIKLLKMSIVATTFFIFFSFYLLLFVTSLSLKCSSWLGTSSLCIHAYQKLHGQVRLCFENKHQTSKQHAFRSFQVPSPSYQKSQLLMWRGGTSCVHFHSFILLLLKMQVGVGAFLGQVRLI